MKAMVLSVGLSGAADGGFPPEFCLFSIVSNAVLRDLPAYNAGGVAASTQGMGVPPLKR
jgi:hypothetical protein